MCLETEKLIKIVLNSKNKYENNFIKMIIETKVLYNIKETNIKRFDSLLQHTVYMRHLQKIIILP